MTQNKIIRMTLKKYYFKLIIYVALTIGCLYGGAYVCDVYRNYWWSDPTLILMILGFFIFAALIFHTITEKP